MIFDRFLVIHEPEHSCPLVSIAHALQKRGYEVDFDALQRELRQRDFPRWYAAPHQFRRMMERTGIKEWKIHDYAERKDDFWMETSPPANLRFTETFMRLYQTAIELLPDPKEPRFCTDKIEKFPFGTFRRVRFAVCEGETLRSKVAWDLCINKKATGILFKEAFD